MAGRIYEDAQGLGQIQRYEVREIGDRLEGWGASVTTPGVFKRRN